jgi:hypothetical protein
MIDLEKLKQLLGASDSNQEDDGQTEQQGQVLDALR